MSLPERMKPTKVSSKKINVLADKAAFILSEIDKGAKEDDAALKDMIAEWNREVVRPYVFSDFRDFSSWTSAEQFTKMAFNVEKFYADFTWGELLQTIDFACDASSTESEQDFAISLLEENFNGNLSDLLFWPNEWFQNPDMLHVSLTTEEIAGYLMARSGRQLPDAPEIELKYPIPVAS